MFHVTGSVHGMKRTDKSPHKLLLLCDASNSERGTKKKRSALEYPIIPSVIRPVPHCEGLPIPETHFRHPPSPDSLSIDCDNEEENTPGETAAIFFKISGIFLNVTSAEPH
jgi:hypothetical protein